MAHLSVIVHYAVGADLVACTLPIVIHKHQHCFIILSINIIVPDINKF